MSRLLLFFMLPFAALQSGAYQLSGGEIQFIYLSEGQYRVNLIHYYDTLSNENGDDGPDPFAFVYIFRNSDSQNMSNQILFPADPTQFQNLQLSCKSDQLGTRVMVYTNIVKLEPALYDDPEGYYLSWERCCRNARLSNILDPANTGINYVLEIPPLQVASQSYINSSPIFTALQSDFACLDQPYLVDFSATDLDGDSLVYSFVTPYTTTRTRPGIFNAQPKPHLEVQFLPEYAFDSPFSSASPVSLSSDGQLSFVPTQPGLFAYAVVVEEYREGQKIGEVRRECQLLVDSNCAVPDPSFKPTLEVANSMSFDPDMDTLILISGQTNCIEFTASNLNPGDDLRLQARLRDLSVDISQFLSPKVAVAVDSQLPISLCIPDCFFTRDNASSVEVIIEKRQCPFSLFDTLSLAILPQEEPNSKPNFTVPERQITRDRNDTDPFSQTISAFDVDGDEMDLRLVVENVGNPSLFGFDLEIIESTGGFLQANFLWDTDCSLYDFDSMNSFDIKILVDDFDRCDLPGDSLSIEAVYNKVANQGPVISIEKQLPDQIQVGDSLAFDLFVSDPDGSNVGLRFEVEGFESSELGMGLIETSESNRYEFQWDLSCENPALEDPGELEIQFIASDFDRCGDSKFDTLRYTVNVSETNLQEWRSRFDPPNAFSPNGDGINDVFKLTGNSNTGSNLPPDICDNLFEEIVIFNRAGQEVFTSRARDFRWEGIDENPGTFFYIIRFTSEQFKGTLQLLK